MTARVKLFDSELKVLDILWQEGSATAKRIAELLHKQVGWSKTTTYTVIKKCIDKGAIRRQDPHFVCYPLISRQEAQETETTALINKMYNGAADQLVTFILGRKSLNAEEIKRLKQLVDNLNGGDI